MNFIKVIFVLVACSLSVAFASDSDLNKLLEKKSSNYQLLHDYYSALLQNVNRAEIKSFCTHVQDNEPVLISIFEDDQILIKSLRKSSNPDHLEYATQLEENSYSPLFSSAAHTDLCNNRPDEILNLKVSLQYHVMNIDYLNTVNELFRETIELRK